MLPSDSSGAAYAHEKLARALAEHLGQPLLSAAGAPPLLQPRRAQQPQRAQLQAPQHAHAHASMRAPALHRDSSPSPAAAAPAVVHAPRLVRGLRSRQPLHPPRTQQQQQQPQNVSAGASVHSAATAGRFEAAWAPVAPVAAEQQTSGTGSSSRPDTGMRSPFASRSLGRPQPAAQPSTYAYASAPSAPVLPSSSPSLARPRFRDQLPLPVFSPEEDEEEPFLTAHTQQQQQQQPQPNHSHHVNSFGHSHNPPPQRAAYLPLPLPFDVDDMREESMSPPQPTALHPHTLPGPTPALAPTPLPLPLPVIPPRTSPPAQRSPEDVFNLLFGDGQAHGQQQAPHTPTQPHEQQQQPAHSQHTTSQTGVNQAHEEAADFEHRSIQQQAHEQQPAHSAVTASIPPTPHATPVSLSPSSLAPLSSFSASSASAAPSAPLRLSFGALSSSCPPAAASADPALHLYPPAQYVTSTDVPDGARTPPIPTNDSFAEVAREVRAARGRIKPRAEPVAVTRGTRGDRGRGSGRRGSSGGSSSDESSGGRRKKAPSSDGGGGGRSVKEVMAERGRRHAKYLAHNSRSHAYEERASSAEEDTRARYAPHPTPPMFSAARPPQVRASLDDAERLHNSLTFEKLGAAAARRVAATPPPPDDDDEDQPIVGMRRQTEPIARAAAAGAAAAPTLRSGFKPPRSAHTGGGSMSANTAVPSSGRATLNPSSSSSAPSSLEPERLCPIRFYPPSYLASLPPTPGSGQVRVPASLMPSVEPERVMLRGVELGSAAQTALFSSPDTYAEFFTRLLCREMQGQVNRVSERFLQVVQQMQQRAAAGQNQAAAHAAALVQARGQVGWPPRVGTHPSHTMSGSEVQAACRAAGLAYYDSSVIEMTCFDAGKFKQRKAARDKWNKRKRGGKGHTPDDDEPDEPPSAPGDDMHMYLRLLDPSARERRAGLSSSGGGGSEGLAEGDLWLLSSDQLFDLSPDAVRSHRNSAALGHPPTAWFPPLSRHSFTLLVYSRWRSFSSEKNQLSIAPLPTHPSNANVQMFFKMTAEHQRTYALRLGNFKSEIDMLRLIHQRVGSVHAAPLKEAPLLPWLLHGPHWPHFRAHYDAESGWVDDSRRAEVERKRMQRMHQPSLQLGAAASTAASSSASSSVSQGGVSFEPLSHRKSHLLPTLVVLDALLRDVLADVQDEFALNDDQAAVLHKAAGWFWTKQSQPGEGANGHAVTSRQAPTASPIQLVHGCFGSGKSYLLVVLVVFLTRLLDKVDPDCRIKILIASLTNVAVDGILLGLQKVRVEFARIGSLRKVAPPILRHMIHMGTSASGHNGQQESEKTALQDLRNMLAEMDGHRGDPSEPPPNAEDRWHLQRAIEELQAKGQRRRKDRLHKTRVVGITTAACEFDIINDTEMALRYPIVLLDESSQMVEPASIVPLIRFKAERLLAVGDPKQLPPTLPGSEDSGSNANQDPTGLTRTLFVRLQQAGVDWTMLRTQYRCHPKLSEIPSRLYYDGCLLDGTSAESRFPFLTPLPGAVNRVPFTPLQMVCVPNGAEQGSSYGRGSLHNEAEAQAIRDLITVLLIQGVRPSQMGVIVPYRAQAALIRRHLASVMVEPRSRQAVPEQTYAADATGRKKGGKAALHMPTSASAQVSGSGVQVSTVDAFQGAEKDLILLSMTRTVSTDFIDNPHRLNVSLTRAKHHLIIVGHAPNMRRCTVLGQLVGAACAEVGAYAPNVKVAIERYQRLELNPTLTDTTHDDEMAECSSEGSHAAGSSKPLSLSMRNVAMEFQHQSKQATHPKARSTHSKSASSKSSAHAAPAASPSADDFDLVATSSSDTDAPVPKRRRRNGTRNHSTELSGEEAAGMSPYTRERVLSGEDIDDDDEDDGGGGEEAPVSVSLADKLARQHQRELQKRREAEKRPAAFNAGEDSDEGEAEYLDHVAGRSHSAAPVAAEHMTHHGAPDAVAIVESPSNSSSAAEGEREESGGEETR